MEKSAAGSWLVNIFGVVAQLARRRRQISSRPIGSKPIGSKPVAGQKSFTALLVDSKSIARGFFDEAALSAVHQRLESVLEAEGARLDGAYYCPYLDGPEAVVEAVNVTDSTT